MLDFKGKVAVITGAAAGLGRAYATHLAAAGASVLVADNGVSSEARWTAETAADELVASGYSARYHAGNVGIESDAIDIVQDAIRQFGRVDILVNNAGNSTGGRFASLTTEDFESVLAVHVYGSFWTMREALKQMQIQGYGRIVNTSSTVGAFGHPMAAPYATAKAAILGLTKTAALEYERMDIRINAIAPLASTTLASAFFKANPSANPERLTVAQVVPVVSYLCHRSCRVTGKVFTSAGGRTASFFMGTSEGLYQPGLADDQVDRLLDAILSQADPVMPSCALDEIALLNALHHREAAPR